MMFTILLTSCITTGAIIIPEYSYEQMARYNDPFSSDDIYFYPYTWERMDFAKKSASESVEIEVLAHKRWKKIKAKKDHSKYDLLLAKKKEELIQRRAEREQARTAFLQGFYDDLYQMTPKAFTKKYRKHTSDTLRSKLKQLYALNHDGKTGYAWAAFGDNKMHSAGDFKIQPGNMDGKIKVFKYYNYKDSMPYIRYDKTWYTATIDGQSINIKLTGDKKFVVINAVDNPILKIDLRHHPVIIAK